MKVKILGSSSKGNCYLLEAAGEILVLEAGVRLSDVKIALDFDLSRIVGCLVTHEHGDHSRALTDFLKLGKYVMALPDVFLAAGVGSHHYRKDIRPGGKYKIGRFFIYVLQVQHDVPCVAFLIRHPECGSVLFATDTAFFDYHITGLNHIFIECNYADSLLEDNIEKGFLPASMRNRLHGSHMELETTKRVLLATDLSKVTTICLIHLSGNNADPQRFEQEIEKLIGLPVTIARKGIELELQNTPF